MPCKHRTEPIVTFEQDVPVAEFTVYKGGAPYVLLNYDPELHVVTPDFKQQMVFGLTDLGQGRLALEVPNDQTPEEFYAELAELLVDVSYKAQIYLKPGIPPSEDIGLLDVVSPYWEAYIPPEGHVPGWFSGQPAAAQTIPVEFNFDVRESFRLREVQNG